MSFDFSPANLDREFPVRRNLVYFNHAAVAPLPRPVADAIEAHTENLKLRGAADWRRWYGDVAKAREKAAAFVGAQGTEIAFAPSTSWGLNLVASAFDWQAGDNVVTDDMEFPANVYPWMVLQKRGVEMRLARNRAGRVGVEDIAAVVDERTKIVAVSWVAFHNGWVYPLDEIGSFCRDRGILFVVDAIQGLGALPIDLSSAPIDVLVADSHKWLLGQEACAILYVRESAAERLPPPFGGWWNVKGDETEGFLGYDLAFHPGGRRYEPGSIPIAQIIGLAAALDLLTEMGQPAVLDRILHVTTALAAGLSGCGWRVASPAPLASGILAAAPPVGNEMAVVKELEKQGIIAAPRQKAVRFSPHAYNDEAEVARVLEAIDALG